MPHRHTKQIKIADKMLSQRARDGDVCHCRQSQQRQRPRRQPAILFNLNTMATMYQLLSIFIFYLMFTTHDAVVAADNQSDGGGGGGGNGNDVNDGFTVGPEAITTTFGECFPSLFLSFMRLFVFGSAFFTFLVKNNVHGSMLASAQKLNWKIVCLQPI